MKLPFTQSIALLLLAFGSVAEPFDLNHYTSSLNYAQVIGVSAVQRKNETWCISATVKHNDQGWEHYADGWEVIDFEGNQLGERPLAHPHDKEQPFTRSQCGITIPKELTQVIVRAKCSKHGFGGKAFVLDLQQSKNE
jgi:hypothetical protein